MKKVLLSVGIFQLLACAFFAFSAPALEHSYEVLIQTGVQPEWKGELFHWFLIVMTAISGIAGFFSLKEAWKPTWQTC